MAQLRMYVVAEFPEEETNSAAGIPMALVCKAWIVEEHQHFYCLWPNYFGSEAERLRAVKKNAEVLDTKRCTKSKITIKYCSNVFEKAATKLKRLESDSTVSQTDEEYERSVPTSTLSRLKRRNVLLDGYASLPSTSSDEDAIPNVPIPQPSGRPPKTPVLPSQPNNKCECAQNKILISQLLTEVKEVKEDIQYLIQLTVQSQQNDLTLVSDTLHTHQTVQEMDAFEEILMNEDNFNKTVALLQGIGGKDVYDTSRRILSKLISNKVALECNWAGRNGKKAFSGLKNTVKCIIVAVRRNPLTKNATQAEVEGLIKNWLRSAGDRDGGRAKRCSKPETN